MRSNDQFPTTNGERRYPVRQLPRITLDGLPQRRSAVLDWIIAAGGLVFLGLAVFFWVRWTEIEWKLFADAERQHLE